MLNLKADVKEMYRRGFLVFLAAIAFISIAIVPSSASDRPEIRGVWLTNVDSDILFSRANLEAGLDRLHDFNFNTIYPTVWQGGYTLYPSTVARETIGRSRYPEPGLQGRDMLQEAVEAARDRGMRILPWFEFGFMAPAGSELVRRHPHWLTQRADNTVVKMQGVLPRVWLNPFHPEVQDFILDLVTEIVSNYDIDGIQFDDHFSLPAEFGYDLYTRYLYARSHNGQQPPVNSDDPEWIRWRADKLTEFVDRVFATIKQHCPTCTVSVSPNPQHWAYPVYLQDWETWERRGYIEELILQVYRPELDRFVRELEYAEVEAARAHIPVGIGILAGLRDRPTDIELLRSKVEAVRDRGFAGVSFFFYETLWIGREPMGERESVLSQLFATPVESPTLH